MQPRGLELTLDYEKNHRSDGIINIGVYLHLASF